MVVDPYASCPCGSGKKLKFCCSDLIAEIEKIQQMVAGEQPHAALKHVEQLLQKQPERSSLLEIKATLEIAMEELDAAKETIAKLLAAHSEDASSHAQSAILTAVTEGGLAAIAPLQDALERTDDNMPQRVFEAIGSVGHALLVEGEIIAARAHLLLYAGVAPKGDNRALELLLRINLQSGLPLMLRDHQILMESDSTVISGDSVGKDASWIGPFQEASRLAARGSWRPAEEILAALQRSTQCPQPPIVYNLAMVRGWLGSRAELAAGLHRFAQLEVPLDDAIEAEALAQLIEPDIEEQTLDSVRIVYPIQDAEALIEKFAADRRVEDYQMEPESNDEEEVIRPRGAYLLLDRPVPSTGVDLARDDVPIISGFLSIYGKRTDRDAQLVLAIDRNDRFDEVIGLLGEVAGDLLGDKFPDSLEETVIAQKTREEDALSWRWRLPSDTPLNHRRKLLNEARRESILERWPQVPRAALGGATPQDIAASESPNASSLENPTIRLLAALLLLEQSVTDPDEHSMINDLRGQLGLSASKTIENAEIDIERFPLVRVLRLNLAIMPDDQLARLLDRTVMVGATIASLVVAKELAERETVSEEINQAIAFRQLIRLTPDPKQALTWIEKARAWSEKNNQPSAEWALQELELQIELRDGARVQRLLEEIQNEHADQPGVAESVYRILQAAGLIAPPNAGQPAAPMPMAHEPSAVPASAGNQLWTPDSRKPPAIWTPS